jgi:peroxiredoxin
VSVDVRLPQVPAGVRRIATGTGRPLLVHYWAPWERHGGAQAQALDSLLRIAPWSEMDVVMVCFDPFPSLARYVARRRLTVPVVLDHRRELARALPCPSVPYTYVLDRDGAIVVAQPGEVDWVSPLTRETLEQVVRSPERRTGHPVALRSRPRSGDPAEL